jgi:hypothetical protein
LFFTSKEAAVITQIIDIERGRFRLYPSGDVLTLGLSDKTDHQVVAVLDPNHQERFFCLFINGIRFPESCEYFPAFGDQVMTPSFTISDGDATTLTASPLYQVEGFIQVQVFKEKGSVDGPMPMMSGDMKGESAPKMPYSEAVATIVPGSLELERNEFLRLGLWRYLKEEAEPTKVRAGWGRPLTPEDREVRQFWSVNIPW